MKKFGFLKIQKKKHIGKCLGIRTIFCLIILFDHHTILNRWATQIYSLSIVNQIPRSAFRIGSRMRHKLVFLTLASRWSVIANSYPLFCLDTTKVLESKAVFSTVPVEPAARVSTAVLVLPNFHSCSITR